PITQTFTYRYYKYAEISLTLLPLFLALGLYKKSKPALFYIGVGLLAWMVVLLSLSRTMFVAGSVSLVLFFGLLWIKQNRQTYFKNSLRLLSLLVILVCLTQISFFPAQETTTLNRLALKDESSQTSFDSRLLFWGIAIESFKQNKLLGTGADNFALDYKNARVSFSALNAENKILEINEDVLPERAHNEYLQILSELGAVGGGLFIWLIGGVFCLFVFTKKAHFSLLSIASAAGIAGFLLSSSASAYSFRVPANGLCFFFLLALGAHGFSKTNRESGFDFAKLKPYFMAGGLMICAAMLIFSGLRGVSLMYLANAQKSVGTAEFEANIQKATALDPDDGLFRFYQAGELYNQGLTAESIPHLNFAVEHGIAGSTSYFMLATAQIRAGKNTAAEQTFTEALRVYPRSVFLRTAFASFLRKSGKDRQSDAENHIALSIDKKQAQSWYLAHSEGLEKLSITAAENKDLSEPMELRPASGAIALRNYQLILKKNP
ncbi:MAG TPA: O-antigen ligase family protein, partial [Pyrinomonadaceae bacterium]|nr:O-antigen ligase family protein [Pyrinomonadaceae bacterium]